MPTQDTRPERTQTDESLAVERAKADDALVEQAQEVERVADQLIERARIDADEVLSTARAKADQQRRAAGGSLRAELGVDRARTREDAELVVARNEADAVLEAQRAASTRILARLLPLERDQTDEHLLTERARADDALAHRDDFLGMVSHDLRGLLNTIVMSVELIADAAGADAAGRAALTNAQRILRAATRMNRLVGDLVDIASIDAGKLAVHPTLGDAQHMVHEAAETWGPLATAKRIVIESRVLGPVPARFDGERVLQVLGNLIVNAVKFSPSGATIGVGVERVGAHARFSVTDTGPGIPADKLEAIFERFWQVGVGDRRGLGLGLYISRCLVEAHGGTIWADSALGAGSAFFFTVPGAP